MNVAIDIDGTLSRYPNQLRALAEKLQSSGCGVFILTASRGEVPKESRPGAVRADIDNHYKMPWIRVVCCEQREKPDICNREKVDILIDDTKFSLHGHPTLQLIPA